MTDSNLLHRRLCNQHLAGPGLKNPEDAVQLLCAMQSQDYAGAKWSVGQRVKNGTDAAVEAAFAAGRILRTHVLRPTWHFVMPSDIRWMLQLTAPRVHALNALYYRKSELDGPVFKRIHRLFERALRDGEHLTRDELATRLEKSRIAATGLRLAYIMMHAELEGLICSGAPRGKQQTYALLEERAPEAKRLDRDEALAELTRRFFIGHGPATLQHYAWWSGLTIADVKAGLAMVREQLSCEVGPGRVEWYGGRSTIKRRVGTSAYLIPEYDECLIGLQDWPEGPRARRQQISPDRYLRPVVIGGEKVGTWKRSIGKEGITVETNLFRRLDRPQAKALAAAVARYGRFLDMPARLA